MLSRTPKQYFWRNLTIYHYKEHHLSDYHTYDCFYTIATGEKF
jgi:hypothetical protein